MSPQQIAGGRRGIFGVMLESFLVAGRQNVKAGQRLVYGQSITDACLDWDTTAPLFEELAHAVHARRERAAAGDLAVR